MVKRKDINPLLLSSGARLAEMIRNREASSLAVVEAHINQIERVNPTINAVVKTRFEQAREEARHADEEIKSLPPEKLPPYHGVPCTIKECFALTGMPNSSGVLARKGIIAEKDATAVARLRKAGAIPLGVTNISELCMWIESSNPVYGRSNNPYNPRRIVGGSSGGEGAIIGAGGSPLGLGSDIGGSIRLPAFFNGVFGHKPSGGMVPNTGQYPIAENEALRYQATGPLCRRAEDLMPLLRVLAGPDGKDQMCREFELGEPSEVRFGELTLLYVEDNGVIKVNPDLRNAQQRSAHFLANLGVKLKEVRIKGLKKSLDIWSAMLSVASETSYSTLLGDGKPINAYWELLKWAFRASDHTLPAIVLAIIERLPKLAASRTKRFVEMGRALREELVELIGAQGIMLYPPYPTPAPLHHKPKFPPFNFAYTAILNVMEFPVTQVPLGLNRKGLPLGVQVAAIPGNDHLTIATAIELEKAFGGWTPPGI
jgi:fatty acid amide hydrolase 2